jgi:hypothetical protein
VQHLANEELGKSHWCDMCEKGFPTKAALEEHENEHATCGIDGCSYTAHSSVLGKRPVQFCLTVLPVFRSWTFRIRARNYLYKSGYFHQKKKNLLENVDFNCYVTFQ